MKIDLRAIRYTLVSLMIFIGSAFAADENPYAKSFSLTIAYQNEGEGSFLVTLKNISDKKLDLALDTKQLEGTFAISEGEAVISEFRDKEYHQWLLCVLWFSGSAQLEPEAEVKWTVKLDELVYSSKRDGIVTKESIMGKTISLRLDRLDVFPVPGESNVRVKISSNAVKIP